MTRSHQSRLALLAGVLLAAPLLTSCGFDYATDRVNTLSAGVSDRDGEVDVLGAVVIAGQADSGLFVATLVNNDSDNPATFTGLTATEEVSPAGQSTPVEIGRGGRVSLIEEGGIPVGGTFAPGDFVDVTLSFEGGQTTTLQVNVVPPCRQYSLDKLGLELPEPTLREDGTTPAEQTGEEYDCEPLPAVEPHAEGGAEDGGGE